MSAKGDSDDEFFQEVYGQGYSGPASGRERRRETKTTIPKTVSESREDEHEDSPPRDPNDLPTDFTTREARVWEAKTKAAERHWKRRKEEELICGECGEYGHFSQGCPSTLGSGGGSGPKKSSHVRNITFTDRRLKPKIIGQGGAVIRGIERESGCKIRLDDKSDGSFIAVITGRSERKVKRAQSAINSVIRKAEEEWKGTGSTREDNRRVRRDEPEREEIRRSVPLSRHSETRQDESYNYGPNYSQEATQYPVYEAQHEQQTFTNYPTQSVPYNNNNNNSNSIPNLQHLEEKFLEETTALCRAQVAAENEERERHAKALDAIREDFQQRLVALGNQQSVERDAFIASQSHVYSQGLQNETSDHGDGGSNGQRIRRRGWDVAPQAQQQEGWQDYQENQYEMVQRREWHDDRGHFH